MKRTILTIILLQLGAAYGQVPGFLGKKLAIGYHMDMGLLPWEILARGIDYEGQNRTLNFNTRNNVSVEYVIGKSYSLEASIGFSKTGMFTYENENDVLRYEYPSLSEYYDGYPTLSEKSYDYIRVDNKMYRLGINVFSGNYIAPHGNYWNFSYIQNRGTVQYVLNGTSKDLSVITHHGLMITRGYRRIILKSVIFDIGFGFGTVFGMEDFKTTKSSEDFNKEKGTIPLQTDLLNAGLWFSGHVGLKYMIPKLGK